MKKKKIVKRNSKLVVPAYQAGIIGTGPNGQYGASTVNMNPYMQQVPVNNGNSVQPMNANMLNQVGNVGDQLGNVAAGLVSPQSIAPSQAAGFSADEQQMIDTAGDKGSAAITGVTDTVGDVVSAIPVFGKAAGGIIKGFGKLGAALFGKSKQKQAVKKAEKMAANRAEYAMSSDLTNMAQAQFAEEDQTANTFAYGGIVPSSLAYVDDNEIIQTPNGDVSEVHDQSNNTDNVLVNMPHGSKVLSDKLKVPGTKLSFAKYYKNKSSKQPKDNVNSIRRQNAVRLNKQNDDDLMNNLIAMQDYEQYRKGVKQGSKPLPAYKNGTNYSIPGQYDDVNEWYYGDPSVINYDYATIKKAGNSRKDPYVNLNPIYGDVSGKGIKSKLNKFMYNSSKQLGNLSNMAETISPVIYNAIQGIKTPEYVTAIENPYTSGISGLLSNRRFNVNPLISANRRSTAIANYNINQNTRGGANLASRIQLANAQYKANNDIYAQKQNTDNAYKGEYANALNNLGQQSVQSRTTARDINMRNRAARDNSMATALSQLSQYAQTKKQMANQMAIQEAMMPMWEKFLSRGVESDVLGNFTNNINRIYNNRFI